MKSNLKTMLSIGVVSLLVACQVDKDPVPIVSTPAATAATFNDLSNRALNDLVQKTSFDAGAGLNFTSTGGVKINIPANCVKTPDGLANATGMLDVEFVEMFNKENMLTTAMPTTGYDATDMTQKIMQSGGEFKLEVKKAGVNQKCGCTVTMQVPFKNALLLADANQMKMFKLDTNMQDATKKVWKLEDRMQVKPIDGPNAAGQGAINTFLVSLPEFGWTNIDKFYNFTGPKVKIMATVPAGYDNTNSTVYLMYKAMPNALARLDTYDAASKVFSEHYGQIPVGQECHIIFVTEDSGYWKYAIKQNVTIPAMPTTYNFSLPETVTADRASFIAALKTLP